jgi:hypothetical protein
MELEKQKHKNSPKQPNVDEESLYTIVLEVQIMRKRGRMAELKK